MSITDFLNARIAEDEKVARAVIGSNGKPDGKGMWSVQIGVTGNGAQFAHVGTDPYRVLAECATKRAIVEQCREDHEHGLASGDDATELATVILYALAAIYAEHPAYRDEWRVGA